MFFDRRSLRNLAALLTVCLSLAGCQQQEVTQLGEMDFPTALTDDDRTWVKQTRGVKQDKQIAAHFAKRRYLAGNPAFEGQRVVYTDELGNERFYWVMPSEDGAQWLYIEFRGSRGGESVEGTGMPF